jgi:hypothetical protein
MTAKLNIHDFNILKESVIKLSESGHLSEGFALDLIDKVDALRVETLSMEQVYEEYGFGTFPSH